MEKGLTAQHFPGNHAYPHAQLLMELHRLCTESERYGETAQRARGLSRTDMHAIAALGWPDEADKEVTVSDLAAHLVLSLPATTAVVDRLVAHGMVERRRSTKDRRRVNLVPTREAEAMGREMFQPMARRMQQVLETFTEAERDVLARLLPPLSGAIVEAHEHLIADAHERVPPRHHTPTAAHADPEDVHLSHDGFVVE